MRFSEDRYGDIYDGLFDIKTGVSKALSGCMIASDQVLIERLIKIADVAENLMFQLSFNGAHYEDSPFCSPTCANYKDD